MDRIAAQALVSVATAAEATGFSRPELARRAGLTPARLEDPEGRCSWNEYVRLFEALEASGATPADFHRLGRHTTTHPDLHPVVRMTRAFLTPRALHLGYIQWILPRHFPLIAARVQLEGPHRIHLRLRVPDDKPVHGGFFHYLHGCATSATEEIGLPPANVSLEVAEREASYVIRLPSDRTIWNRLRLFGRMLFRSEEFIAELGVQQREINEYYDALLRTRRNFQHVIERLPDAVVIHRDGIVVYANTAAAALLGLPAAPSLVGRALLDMVHPDDRERAAQLLAGGPRRDAGFEPVRGQRQDGRELLLEVAPTQAIEFDDREAALTLVRDVTERRRLEEKLAAADRLSSLGAVSAGVAHELNNPLAYIALNLRALARAIESIPNEEARERAREAAAAAGHGVERASTIVRDLNSFARPEKDSVEVVDLRDVIDTATGMLGRETKSAARVVRRFASSSPVLANRSRLEQVFVNLILNALQAFSRDDSERNEVVLEVTSEGEWAVAEVRDNGRGISEEIRPRIFDPLFTTKPVGEGTGLGLSICHGIVAAAGGYIDVQSTEGAGASFRVALPRATAASLERAEMGDHRAPPPRRRILVVDDEPALLHALRAVLGEVHDVVIKSNGFDALELLRRDPHFDLILCDLIMSGMSGMDLHGELAQSDPELVRRLVFMTGGASTRRARAFLDKAPNRVLEKPFHFDKLLAYVEDCIASRGEAAPAPEDA